MLMYWYLIFFKNPTIQVLHVHLIAFYLLHVFFQCSKDILQERKSVWFKPILQFSKLLTRYRRAIFTEINLSIHAAASPWEQSSLWLLGGFDSSWMPTLLGQQNCLEYLSQPTTIQHCSQVQSIWKFQNVDPLGRDKWGPKACVSVKCCISGPEYMFFWTILAVWSGFWNSELQCTHRYFC